MGLGQFYRTVCRHGTIPVTNCHEKIFSGIALGAREYAGMGWERCMELHWGELFASYSILT